MTATIVVGVDGSKHAARAVKWCAEHAAALGAEVVVVHVVETPGYGIAMGPYGVGIPPCSPEELEELRDVVTRDWSKPLADAGVRYRVILEEGRPANVLTRVSDAEGAELVVTGRRGRSGLADVLLGSTSRQLSHHLDHPLVIVP